MKLTTHINLTKEEVSEAINEYIEERFKYDSRKPRGEVLTIIFGEGATVLWGIKEEPEEETPVVPLPVSVEATSQEVL